jgi:hypothetical protein
LKLGIAKISLKVIFAVPQQVVPQTLVISGFQAPARYFLVLLSGDSQCSDVVTKLPVSTRGILAFGLAEISGFRTHHLEVIFTVVADVKRMTAGHATRPTLPGVRDTTATCRWRTSCGNFVDVN